MLESKKNNIKIVFYNISLIGVSILLSLIAIEVVLRLFNPQILNRTEDMYVKDDQLCFKMKRNFSGYHVDPEFTVKIETNSKGLRDREIAYPNDKDKCRILAIGDSFTFGNGVEDYQSFPKVLEALLNKKRDYYEVINAGVNGYGTDDELLFLKTEGYKYNPNIVILGFHVNNDIYDNLYPCVVDVLNGFLVSKSEIDIYRSNILKKSITDTKLFLRTNFHCYRFIGDKYHLLLNNFRAPDPSWNYFSRGLDIYRTYKICSK